MRISKFGLIITRMRNKIDLLFFLASSRQNALNLKNKLSWKNLETKIK
jgi:hypothetical protein